MFDASQRHASRELFAEGYLLEDQTLEWFYECHAREPQDRDDPRFSPLLTEELGNCLPAWIGLTHDFLGMSSVAPAVLEVYDEMAGALKRYLG